MVEQQEIWKELIPLLSVEGQPTKAASAQTRMGAFLIRSVSDDNFPMSFLANPRVPQLE
jgi:hypothetical protein